MQKESKPSLIKQFSVLEKDARRLIAGLSLASVSGGYIDVVQSIFLSLLGFNTVMIGLITSVQFLSISLQNMLFGFLADKYGRKKILILTNSIHLLPNLIYIFSSDYNMFLVAAIIGISRQVGFGGGVFNALMSDKVGDLGRTIAFSIQFFATSSCAAVGGLFSGLPEFLAQYGIDIISGIRILFLIRLILMIIAVLLILPVKEEIKKNKIEPRAKYKRSWGLTAKFSLFNLLNALGMQIIVPLFSLWFYLRFNISMTTIGYIFSVSRITEAFAYLIGPILTPKLGIIKTIFVTRFGGILCIYLIPLAPTPLIAGLLYAGRNSILHIAHPLRASYMMAVLKPEERASSSGITQVASLPPRFIGSTLGGYLMQEVSLSLPLFISAIAFTIDNIFYYLLFYKLKPPEERK